MNKKLLIIVGGIAAVAALIITLIFVFSGEDSYRSIKVFEIDGSCKVERDGDSLDAFKNMALSSGDSLTVGDGSFARLKLDDDKYVYLEANTKINLTATGTANDSKTMVYIERGSMLTEVKKKLSATSSYDIVTPNTTMSIRGTKTLTEVYEDVLGAIKTSTAVVEGQVSFKTVQKDSTGKAVMVSTDLSVGQGFGVTTEKKDLLSQADIKQIAEDGKTADGQVAEETTHEELGTNLEAPAFSEDFLTNVVAVLARSREEDVEEGFVAEDVTEEELNAAINVLNDVIDGKILLPASVEQYIISQTQPYYDEPVGFDEPVTSDDSDSAFVQQPAESELGSTADDTPLSEETEGDGDDTLDVDETAETPVVIEDDTDDSDSADVADDRTVDDQDDTDEADDAEDDESDETDDDGSDEGDASDEDTEDGDEEDEDKEDSEETEDEEKEEESEETEDETEQEQEEQTEDAPTQTPSSTGTDDGSTGTQGSASETTPTNVSFSYGSTTAYVSVGSSSTDTQAITLSFYEVTSSGGSSSDRHVLNEGELPTTVAVGSALPGTQNSPIHVELGEQWSAQYEFDGWYTSANGARDLNQSEKVTVAQSGITSLYPGVKEKTFTVTFVNLFPEAGKLVIPEEQYRGNYVYSVVDSEANSRITISGIPYEGKISLPELGEKLTSEQLNKAQYLHIEGAKDPHNGEEGPFFDGVGVADSGSSDSLAYSRNLNMTRILMNDSEYIQSVGSGFIAYGDGSGYSSEKTIISDTTYYLYFSIPVHITVSDRYDLVTEKYFGRMNDVNGNSVSVYDALKTYPGYDNEGNYDNGQFVKLSAGNSGQGASANDYDQYWMVTKEVGQNNQGDPNWLFSSHYYGKPLDIPAFSWSEPGEIYLPYYTVSSTGNKISYINEASAGSSAALALSGTGSTSFPYNKHRDNNDGFLSVGSLSFVLEKTTYALLDLSDTGINVELGDSFIDVIRTSTGQSGMVNVKTIKEHIANSWAAYWAETPEDGIYNMRAGGREWSDTELDNVKDSRFLISKTGYRLAGYYVSAYDWNDEDFSDRIDLTLPLVNKDEYGSRGSYCFIDDYIIDEYGLNITYLAESNCKYVLKPLFVKAEQQQPFNIELVRDPGHIKKTSDNDILMDHYKVEISFTQPYNPDGTAYITSIDLSSFLVKGYVYGFEEQEFRLAGTIEWDPSESKYMLKVNYNVIEEYAILDNKIGIELSKLITDTGFANVQYVQGIDVKPDSAQTIYVDESITHYTTSVTLYNDCGISRDDDPDSDTYYPWGYHIEIDKNAAPRAFTAVYAKNGPDYSVSAIFSEVKDTLPNDLLLTLSGESNLENVWYGGILRDEGKYGSGCFNNQELSQIFPWEVTRTSTGGPASRAIKGNPAEYPNHNTHILDGVLYDFGCGILVFEKYGRLSIPNDQLNSVKVYPNIGDDSLAILDNALDKSKVTDPTGYDERIITVSEFTDQTTLSLKLGENAVCKEGWAHVVNANGQDGFIFFGNNGDIDGGLIMTEGEEYFLPGFEQ